MATLTGKKNPADRINHVNSHKVTIFRAPSFVEKSQNINDASVQEYIGMSSAAIGPYFEDRNSNTIGTGLSAEEVKILMPRIVYLQPDDRDFPGKVRSFFNNLNTKIPFSTGLDLEIGLLKKNDDPISESNLPIKIIDFVRYRHILNHPWVAETKEEAEGNRKKQFYILDRERQSEENIEKAALADIVMGYYMKVKDDEVKVTQLLTLLGEDPRDYTSRNAKEQKVLKLRSIALTKPDDFKQVYEVDRFETMYWLKAMIRAGVISKHGQKYVIAGTGKVMANDDTEALLFLEDEIANSEMIIKLKADTTEVLGKPRVKKQ